MFHLHFSNTNLYLWGYSLNEQGMNSDISFDPFHKYRRKLGHFLVPLLILMCFGVAVLVYVTGGIKFVFSHSMYLPILLGGLSLGFRGGAFFAVLGGLLLGPFMPIDTISGEMQTSVNWLYRTGFFSVVGIVSGIASDSVRSYFKHLEWLSLHDISTTLPNRKALLETITSFKDFRHGSFYLYLFSFENSEELQSSFGRSSLEEASKQFVQRFQKILPVSAGIFRSDPNQLAIVIHVNEENKTTPNESAMLDKLLELCQLPFTFNGISIHVDVRVGYDFFDCTKKRLIENPEFYLLNAESALLVAREKGLSSMAYTEEINENKKHNIKTLGELKQGIERKELFLYYQPKISIATGKLLGVESLLRWNHPTMGFVPPSNFIPRAEQSSLIDLITDFVLEESISQAKKWHEQGIKISVAVNISTRNLLQPNFVSKVLDLINHYQLAPHYLELELTESSLMLDMTKAIDQLKRLSENDITISIDDFGTGYSSLQYLHLLPISFIKIDQSFILKLPQDISATHIVEATITLAQRQGIQTIAEGVENQEIFTFLKNANCDYAQGYWISRPLPSADIPLWYADHQIFVP